jgi:hypothetical protein
MSALGRWRSALGRPTFILGTGRSGTHWLAEILASHPGVRVTIERQPIFGWATRIAVDPRRKRQLLPRLLLAYRLQLLRTAPRLYADKSHPCIWFAEDLARTFPKARFLGIEREPYATVASMLRHRGVSAWHKRWRKLPLPNPFLGIDEATAETYDELSLAARAALRWKSHHERLIELTGSLGDRFLLVRYEDLAADPAAELARIQGFLGLDTPFQTPSIKHESLAKWRSQLEPADIDAIRTVVGFEPPTA